MPAYNITVQHRQDNAALEGLRRALNSNRLAQHSALEQIAKDQGAVDRARAEHSRLTIEEAQIVAGVQALGGFKYNPPQNMAAEAKAAPASVASRSTASHCPSCGCDLASPSPAHARWCLLGGRGPIDPDSILVTRGNKGFLITREEILDNLAPAMMQERLQRLIGETERPRTPAETIMRAGE